ncbi:winged helix-turn-helix transcriptional regulator [Thalassomonas haliotis]|uniref:Helix-turn-helix transcriptional regulator n=1 Tax=Thalassomonas haliotis TaxID=485448 RepID=A0ABY7VB58_9GAMM|nr:helix-turn-helix domain-containing protein [Thalassomonas haliotis]WDE10571.1 helix-turn-helix transcriptional regulator [Thalassomonas haliotis]
MPLPLPGLPVRGSKTGKPIMALLDLLGRNWTLGIFWNLSQNPCTFRELQNRCENISPTLLNNRLKELQATLFVQKQAGGYALTELGEELFNHMKPLEGFSSLWQQQLADSQQSQVAQHHHKD